MSDLSRYMRLEIAILILAWSIAIFNTPDRETLVYLALDATWIFFRGLRLEKKSEARND